MNAIRTLPQPILPANGLWARGKALAGFYKVGIVNSWRNRRISADIRRKYRVRNSHEFASAIEETDHLRAIEEVHLGVINEKARSALPSREEFLTVVRSERDTRKVPLFAVVFAICFECTPLVLMVWPSLAPSTCYSVKYIQKLNSRYTRERLKLSNQDVSDATSVYMMPRPGLEVFYKCVLGGSTLAARIAPLAYLRQKVARHITMVRADDCLIRRGNIRDLIPEEMRRACAMRGLPLDAPPELLERWLKEFLEPKDAGLWAHAARWTI